MERKWPSRRARGSATQGAASFLSMARNMAYPQAIAAGFLPVLTEYFTAGGECLGGVTSRDGAANRCRNPGWGHYVGIEYLPAAI